MPRWICGLFAVLASCLCAPSAVAPFRLAPAVAVEAEDFTVERGWKVVRNGAGNYMVDIIGFNHISGERLLALEAENSTALAHADLTVPRTGRYRLWVRYEYPPGCETRFRIAVEQGGKKVAEQVMGTKDSLRYAALDGRYERKAQHDPAWGPEGLVEEVLTVPALQAGKARIVLRAEAQPQTAGVAARRHIDLVYLTSDTTDAWVAHYTKQNKLYPILDAFRDTRGPRWEVRFTNQAAAPADFRIRHTYNRIPWGYTDPATVRGVPPGTTSAWVGLSGQDTAHFGMTQFDSSAGAFAVEVRPVGSTNAVRKLSGSSPLRLYLPPYPARGETPTTPEEAIDAILAELKGSKAPGKKPTQPLCYGGWMPLGQDNAYGRKYAELYAALGFRSLHPAHSGPAQVKNLQAVGIEPTRSWMVMSYRNPPTRSNIDRAKREVTRLGMDRYVRFYDYGDEIAFSEWLGMLVTEEVEKSKKAGKPLTARQVIVKLWLEWLQKNRPKQRVLDYWLPTWGPYNPAGVRPDSSAEAAAGNPRLYVDSLQFYEEMAIRFAADGAQAVRRELGEDVLCGANHSCHPFYYPHSTMYIRWFRGGAADLGRHSEYFWQVAQAGPMVNGYIAEHFRAGMRDNPKAVLRQYTMPHAPGNTDGNFLRSAFSHLAHGATMLDFFGVGLNESFTENHIDHRARSRYRAIRDITHCVGLVEDLLPKARAVPSRVALLVSESTERWDLAATATDHAGHAAFGPDFRKTRLHFHLERLGIWKALTFLGCSPDLVTEDDILAGKLKGYQAVVLVGDHWPGKMVSALETWVQAGGVALSTAAAGLKDEYGAPSEDWYRLAGLRKVATEQRTTFLRPRQELPFLKPLGWVVGDRTEMPVLATVQSAEAGDAKVRGKFKDGKPALFYREVGKGKVIHLAAHLGLAYLWPALVPPAVPDRGPGTHTVPTRWGEGAREILAWVLKQARIEPAILTDGALLDTRLLAAPEGFLLPIANYQDGSKEKITLKVQVPGTITKVTSAYHGKLPFELSKGVLRVTLPALGYGDILRLDGEGTRKPRTK